jgi:hypothetical protein
VGVECGWKYDKERVRCEKGRKGEKRGGKIEIEKDRKRSKRYLNQSSATQFDAFALAGG